MYFITFHLTLDVQFTLMQYDTINLHHLNNIIVTNDLFLLI